MEPLENLTARCDHIGQQLATWALSEHGLFDRAVALNVLAGELEELMAEEHAAMTPVHRAVRVRQEIEAARTALRNAATAVQARARTHRMGTQSERLLGVQRHL